MTSRKQALLQTQTELAGILCLGQKAQLDGIQHTGNRPCASWDGFKKKNKEIRLGVAATCLSSETLERLRQEDRCVFQASLGYEVRPCGIQMHDAQVSPVRWCNICTEPLHTPFTPSLDDLENSMQCASCAHS